LEKDLLKVLSFHELKTVLVAGRRKREVGDRLGKRFPIELAAQEDEGFEAALGGGPPSWPTGSGAGDMLRSWTTLACAT
jgi:hypothetical protein